MPGKSVFEHDSLNLISASDISLTLKSRRVSFVFKATTISFKRERKTKIVNFNKNLA